MKRCVSLLLVLALVLCILPPVYADGPVYNGVVYSPDYTTWSQRDPAWGKLPLGNLCTLESSGCLMTTIAILMCQAGVYDAAGFNPGVLRDYLEGAGLVSHASTRSADGNLNLQRLEEAIPRFTYQGMRYASSFSGLCQKAGELMAEGYCVAAMVRSGRHYVAVLQAGETDCVIADPYYGHTSLSAWSGTILGLLAFLPDPAGADVIGCLSDPNILAFRQSEQPAAGVCVLNAGTALYYSPGLTSPTSRSVAAGQLVECVSQGVNAAGELWYRTTGNSYLPAAALRWIDTTLYGYSIPERTLSSGTSGYDVTWLQLALYRLGYAVVVDGSYGPGTAAAVKQFQTACGLEADGAVGSQTRLALVEQLLLLWYQQTGTVYPGTSNPASEPSAASSAAAPPAAPAETVTRSGLARALYALWRDAGGNTFQYQTSPFSDVAITDGDFQAIAWCQGCALISGYPDGTFQPTQAVSRQQLCAVLSALADHAGLALPEGNAPVFTDQASIAVWAADSVTSCVRSGLLSQAGDGSFRPDAPVTPVELDVALIRLTAYLQATEA